MAFKNGYRLWDDDFEQAFWTHEEIAASNAKVARIGKIIETEQQGYITHEEAMTRHLIEDPDLAEVMLEDAIADGDTKEIERIQRRITEAQKRIQAQTYWDGVLDNARDAVKKGQNLSEIYSRLVEAVNTVKAAMV